MTNRRTVWLVIPLNRNRTRKPAVSAMMEPFVPDSEPAPLPSSAVPPKAAPGILQSIALSVIFYVIVIGVAIPLELGKQLGRIEIDAALALAVELVIAWPIVFWICTVWSRTPFRQACGIRRFPLRIVPAVVVASLGATILLLEVVCWIPMSQSAKEAFGQLANSSAVTLFIPMVIIAPIAEEMFFRGQVLGGYLGRYSTTQAVWGSAILFAVFHLNPWQGVIALPLGLVYGWLVLRTGSVLPGMLSHAIVNFSTNYLLGPLATALGYSTAELAAMDDLPAGMLVLGGLLTVSGGMLLWWQLPVMPLARKFTQSDSSAAPTAIHAESVPAASESQ